MYAYIFVPGSAGTIAMTIRTCAVLYSIVDVQGAIAGKSDGTALEVAGIDSTDHGT